MKKPFYIRTESDFINFVGEKLQCTRREIEKIETYIRDHRLPDAGILGKIPSSFHINIQVIKKEVAYKFENLPEDFHVDNVHHFIEERKEHINKQLKYLPETLKEFVAGKNRLMEKLNGLIKPNRIKSEVDSHDSFDSSQFPPKVFIAELNNFLANMAHLLQKYIATRKEGIAEFLKQTISERLLYDSTASRLDTKLIDRLHTIPAASFENIVILKKMYVDRLQEIMDLFYLNGFAEFTYQYKQKILKLMIPANVKTSITSYIDLLHKEIPIQTIKEKIDHYLAQVQLPAHENEKTKLISIVNNFCEKISVYESIVQGWMHSDKILEAHRLYYPYCANTEIIEKVMTTGTVLSCYPCKDYGEILKGYISDDCTTETNRAIKHFENPAFFNIRIFHNERWIGNIYMLDFLKDDGVLLIDRIQISRSGRFMPTDFFQSFIKTFTRDISKNVECRIAAPSYISNYGWIQSHYSIFIRKGKFPTINNKYKKHLKGFESCRFTEFNVLYDNTDMCKERE